MIKNVILDMGNVLLDYNPHVPLEAFLENDEDRAIVLNELYKGPEWLMRDAGTISEEGMYEAVSKRVPERLHAGLRRCVYEWPICMIPVPGAKKFCADAKAKGYHLYVLSNASDNFYDYFEKEYPPGTFDGIVVSYEVGIIKPDQRIYEYILKKYQLCPEECVFIDDRLENVNGAKAVGIHALLFEGNYAAIKEQIGKGLQDE